MTPQQIYQRLIGAAGQAYNKGDVGVATDLLNALRTGQMPVTPAAQAILAQGLAGTEYASNPASFLQAWSASGNGGGQGGVAEQVQQGAPPAPALPGAAAPAGVPTQSPAPIVQGAPNQLAGGGGIPQGQDNGIGGGGPQGAAAIVAQARRAAAEAAMPKNAGQQAPGAPGASTAPPTMQAQTLAGGNTGSGFTPAQGMDLSTDDDRLIRFALQQAGMNPDRMTSFTKNVGRQLVPLLRSARSAYGIANDNAVDQMPDFFSQLAGSLTQKGGNFFGNLRGLGEQTIGSENFQNYLAGISNPEDQAAMLQSLLPIRYAGSNPMIQQSAADTAERTLNQFKDQIFNNSGAVPNNGVFLDWLRGQPEADPITRRLFGVR